VHLVPLVSHEDERGSVTEVYRRGWIPEMREALQANLSISKANVLRGLHLHRKQADYWCVLFGTAIIGLYDARAGSPTEGRAATVRIAAGEERRTLYIPKGVAHGFYAETDLILQYLVDEYYTGEDEFGIAWDDPGLGIAWPGADPTLSQRDMSNPSLAEVLRTAPPFEP
jgi:dTDP-4-dehydrorhamnose 3,5-epimerase